MANILDINEKPKIDYPTLWEYKVIFDAQKNAQNEIEKIMAGRKFELSFSKFSKDGGYKSYNLSVLVGSENERLELFAALKRICKYVL